MAGKMKKEALRPERYINEAPSVISMMATVISPGGSIDSAVRYVAEKGPSRSRKLFRDIVSSVDCRSSTDIRDSLYSFASSLPSPLASYRRALYMTISAAETADPAERSRVLKEATDISLVGLRQTGEEYSSKLQTPCMVIFGLGIMVPMILLSIVPMLGMGDAIGMKMTIPEGLIERTILILVPAVLASVMFSIKGKNPLMEPACIGNGIRKALPMVSVIPVYAALMNNGFEQSRCIALSVMIASLITLALVYPDVMSERRRAKIESALRDSMFDLGNRMVAGENFESALVGALSVRKDCEKLAVSLEREYMICRGDIRSAVMTCISPISSLMASFIADVYDASLKDIRDAGRLSTAIAHQLRDQDNVRKGIENKLRNMTDMMNGTAAVFAPLVLGMSLMMTGPLSAVSGNADMSGMFTMIAVYLVELAVLTSVFASILSCRFRMEDVIYRASMTIPAAMVILMVCSSISI